LASIDGTKGIESMPEV